MSSYAADTKYDTSEYNLDVRTEVHSIQKSTKSAPNLVVPNSSFKAKTDYQSNKTIINIRSEKFKVPEKQKDTSDIWKRPPVDFTWKLYQPKPVKRNSKYAMKPWKYDKYDVQSSVDSDSGEEYLKSLRKSFDSVRLDNDTDKLKREELESDFQRNFRALTPNSARMEAAKRMGYRDSLEQYKIPKTYDHRPLPALKSLGLSEFQTRFEADPYNIKFLTNNLSHIHGLAFGNSVKEITGIQMGDKVLKQEEKYIPELILPRLPFPNKFYGYTRYRPENRSVQSAYWERMLDKINEKWNEDKQVAQS